MQNQKIWSCILIVVFLFLAVKSSFAQEKFWEQANGPYGGWVWSLASNSSGHIFAGTDISIFRSTNNGDSWIRVHKSSSFNYSFDYFKILAVNSSDYIFAGTQFDGIFRSTDNGENWTEINSGLSDGYLSVYDIKFNNNGEVFAATDEGLFRSTDNGDNWAEINTGIPNLQFYALAINSTGHIFVSAYDYPNYRILRSTDNGNNWTETTTDLPTDRITSLCMTSNDYILAGVGYDGIYRSTNNGDSWSVVKGGIFSTINSFALNAAGDIFAGTDSYVLRSTDNGSNWTKVNTGLPNIAVNCLAVNPSGKIFAGTGWLSMEGGVYRSNDNGNNWAEVNTGITNILIEEFAFNSTGHIFAVAWETVFRSKDNGRTWERINNGLPDSPAPTARTISVNTSGHIFVGTWGWGVFKSVNNGDTWQKSNNGLQDINGNTPEINALAINSKDQIFAGTSETLIGSIFRSVDNGANWVEINNGLPPATREVISLAIGSNDIIFAGVSYGHIFRSTNNGDNWVDVSNGIPFIRDNLSLAISSNGYVFAGIEDWGIYRSTDNGDSWTQVLAASDADYLPIAINSQGHIYICAEAEGVYRSLDNGDSWEAVHSGLIELDVQILAFNANDRLYAGTNGGGIFISRQPTTKVKIITAKTPSTFRLEQNFPNPFNSKTNIQFSIPKSSLVTLKVYNALGKEMATLVSNNMDAGIHNIEWNAIDLVSGVYYYRLQAGSKIQTKKLLLLK